MVKKFFNISLKDNFKGKTSFEVFSFICSLIVFSIIFVIFISLFWDSYKVFKIFGIRFLYETRWNPVINIYGALPQIYGTLVSSILALVISFPIALLTAFYLTEMAPSSIGKVVSIGVELLAAIPSIIYGMWGLFVFAPYVSKNFYIPLQKILGDTPFFSGPPMGIGILTASIILAIMVLPLIVSICREIFLLIPNMVRESAYAMGATKAEVVFKILFPYAKNGIIGATFLALGRALGETMAVTFVIGNQHKISLSLLSPSSTIASTLANELSEAISELHISSLIALGLILFILSGTVITISKWLIFSSEMRATKN